MPLLAENLDGSSGVLFPYYDPDTHMLYLAGKVRPLNTSKRIIIIKKQHFIHTEFLFYLKKIQGDGNIRYYELSSEKPYIHYLADYRSLLPQKGMGKKHTQNLQGQVQKYN